MTLAERNPLADFRPAPWPEDFGRRLEGLKVLAGVNWQEMGRLLGVTDRAILLWRRGERRPSGANILGHHPTGPQHPRRDRGAVPGRRRGFDPMGKGRGMRGWRCWVGA